MPHVFMYNTEFDISIVDAVVVIIVVDDDLIFNSIHSLELVKT